MCLNVFKSSFKPHGDAAKVPNVTKHLNIDFDGMATISVIFTKMDVSHIQLFDTIRMFFPFGTNLWGNMISLRNGHERI